MIFLDTNYINGLIIKRDSHNNFSKNIRHFLQNETKATNITVLVEVLNSLKANNFNGNFDAILSELVNLDIFDYLSVEDYQKQWICANSTISALIILIALFWYPWKNMGLTK